MAPPQPRPLAIPAPPRARRVAAPTARCVRPDTRAPPSALALAAALSACAAARRDAVSRTVRPVALAARVAAPSLTTLRAAEPPPSLVPPRPRPPAPAPPAPAVPSPAPQFVLVGLDVTPGADAERAFARRVGDAAEAAGARVTFFVNSQFFLLPPGTHRGRPLDADARLWEDPDPRTLRRIQYARSVAEARGRVATTRYLHARGHEVSSHGVHHERGAAWSVAAWRRELATFARHHRALLGLPPTEGFRAPYLSPGASLHAAEAAEGVRYDASRVVPLRAWPWRLGRGGPWEIAVMSGRFQNCNAAVFDDALAQCGFRDETLRRALLDEFEARYRGARAPFVLSAHQGLVEQVYLPLLRDVCARRDVRCVTFAELARYMDAHPSLAGYGRRPGQAGAPSVTDAAPTAPADGEVPR